VISDRPKFLAPVAGFPYADYLLSYLRRESITDVVLCTGHLSDQVLDYCGDGTRWGLTIRYSHEREPLGTGGALKNAQSSVMSDAFWVINGDSLVDARLEPVREFHTARRAVVTLVLTKVQDVSRFGAVSLSPDASISSFREKTVSGEGYINAGISLMNRSVLELISPERSTSLEQDVLPGLVARGLYGCVVHGSFVDIGTEQSLRAAEALLTRWSASG